MITNKYELQQKHRLGTVSKKLLGGLNRFYWIPTSPSASIMASNTPDLPFCYVCLYFKTLLIICDEYLRSLLSGNNLVMNGELKCKTVLSKTKYASRMVFHQSSERFTFSFQNIFCIWTASSEFGTYRLCEQRRFRRACASAQSRQNLRCSLIQAVSQEEPSDRKPDPWPLSMAGHAQLKFVMTECSKTQIRLTGLIW